MNPINLVPGPYRWMAWAALAAAALVAFGTYSAWVYGKGKAHVKAEWDANKAAVVLAGRSDQVDIGKIDLGLQENLDANRDNQPVIAVVPERVCPSVSAKTNLPRKPPAASASPTVAALGQAIKHDADHYPDCVATLDAAQAALMVCQGDERGR